jgi:hypothetical protein
MVQSQIFTFYMWGKLVLVLHRDVTPLVLQELKLGHDIICIDISLCMLYLECIH